MGKFFPSVVKQGVYTKLRTSYLIASIIPILLMTYLASTYILPNFQDHPVITHSVWALIILSLILSILGAHIISNTAKKFLNTNQQICKALIASKQGSFEETDGDEIDEFATRIGEIIQTVNRQTVELNRYAAEVTELNGSLERMNEQMTSGQAEPAIMKKQASGFLDSLANSTIQDPVTQLFNRRYFEECLNREVSRATRHGYSFAIEMIHLDDLGMLNDKYGYFQGDYVLIELAKLLKEHTRSLDTPARYGDNQFCLILSEIDETKAKLHATRFLNAVRNHRFFHGTRRSNLIHPSISMGLAVFPQHGKDHKELLTRAQTALEEAKQNGKNRVGASNLTSDIELHEQDDRSEDMFFTGRKDLIEQPFKVKVG